MPNKIVDCFMFYNEFDLLNYRVKVLRDIVDFFVIVESTHTHTGKEKPLLFNENKHLVEDIKDKIIHIIVDDFPYKCSNINTNISNEDVWKNENYQRNVISRGLNRIDLTDNDLIIISDLDEIPDPRTLTEIKNGKITVSINSLLMGIYYYNLNTKLQLIWDKCKILSYKKYKELNASCNDIRFINAPSILNGGWHLSYFGDSNFIRNKIINFAHQEYNHDTYTNLKDITERVNNHSDIYNRGIKFDFIEIKDNHNLPIDYDKYLTSFYKQ